MLAEHDFEEQRSVLDVRTVSVLVYFLNSLCSSGARGYTYIKLEEAL